MPSRALRGTRWAFAIVVVAPACTHDFSIFELNGAAGAAGGPPNGSDASTRDAGGGGSGGATDGSTATGGSAGSAGGADAGGTTGTGGSGGGSAGGGTDAGAGGSPNDASPGAGGTSSGGAGSLDGGSGGPGTGGAAAGGADAGKPTCASLYATVPGFLLCTETATTCRFAANTGGGTCGTICQGIGRLCLDQDDNGAELCVATTLSDDCNTVRQSAICVCNR